MSNLLNRRPEVSSPEFRRAMPRDTPQRMDEGTEIRKAAYNHGLQVLADPKESKVALELARRIIRGDATAHAALAFGIRLLDGPHLSILISRIWEPTALALEPEAAE
ncbi:MAG: hypothetical protein WKF75_05960 [Singulisphaera sp.]